MDYEILILSESYGRRLPKITAEADSTDDLAILGIDYAEGSTCTVGEDEYVLDKVGGWIIHGSGGGGSDMLVTFTYVDDAYVPDKTFSEVAQAIQAGQSVAAMVVYTDDDTTYSYFTLKQFSESHNHVSIIEFQCVYSNNGEGVILVLMLDSTDSVEFYGYTFALTPD